MPRQIEEILNQQMIKSEYARRRVTESGQQDTRPVVTISRGMGSGARIIAGKLAQDLGWSLWDKELLDFIAEDARVSRKVVDEFDERRKSEIELLIRDALGDHEAGGFIYRKHLARAVAAIAQMGHAIILGRGANFVLPKALNIRIDAPEEVRIRNMMTYEHLSESEAREKIRRSDKERAQFIRQTFGKENSGHCAYHLSLCMCSFTNDGAAEIIKAAIKARFGNI